MKISGLSCVRLLCVDLFIGEGIYISVLKTFINAAIGWQRDSNIMTSYNEDQGNSQAGKITYNF